MIVESVGTTATSASAATSGSRATEMDYMVFLRLLVEQIKNQDPTEPMKASEQLAQLASFSGVEQAATTNKKLDTIMSLLIVAQADGLVGREISSLDGSTRGVVESVQFLPTGGVARLAGGVELPLSGGYEVHRNE